MSFDTQIDVREHRVKSVMIFGSGKAEVVRTFSLNLKEGESKLYFTGLPSCMDMENVKVSGLSGGARMLCVVGTDNVPYNGSNDSQSVSVRLLISQRQALENERCTRETESEILVSQGRSVTEESIPHEQVDAFLNNIVERAREAAESIAEIDERIARLDSDIQNARDSKAPVRGDTHRAVVVMVASDDDRPVNLILTYVVANAKWEPTYELAVVTDNGRPSPVVSLRYNARITQSTGESWVDADLTLSTARASSAILIPELQTRKVVVRGFTQPSEVQPSAFPQLSGLGNSNTVSHAQPNAPTSANPSGLFGSPSPGPSGSGTPSFSAFSHPNTVSQGQPSASASSQPFRLSGSPIPSGNRPGAFGAFGRPNPVASTGKSRGRSFGLPREDDDENEASNSRLISSSAGQSALVPFGNPNPLSNPSSVTSDNRNYGPATMGALVSRAADLNSSLTTTGASSSSAPQASGAFGAPSSDSGAGPLSLFGSFPPARPGDGGQVPPNSNSSSGQPVSGSLFGTPSPRLNHPNPAQPSGNQQLNPPPVTFGSFGSTTAHFNSPAFGSPSTGADVPSGSGFRFNRGNDTGFSQAGGGRFDISSGSVFGGPDLFRGDSNQAQSGPGFFGGQAGFTQGSGPFGGQTAPAQGVGLWGGDSVRQGGTGLAGGNTGFYQGGSGLLGRNSPGVSGQAGGGGAGPSQPGGSGLFDGGGGPSTGTPHGDSGSFGFGAQSGFPMGGPATSSQPGRGGLFGSFLGISGLFGASYQVEGMVTIPSDGVPHQVTIAVLPFQAEITHVVVPRINAVAYVQCRVKNTSRYEFMAGTVDVLVNGNIICTTNIEDTRPGDAFERALHVDPNVHVEHSRIDRTSTFITMFGRKKGTTYTVTTKIGNQGNDGLVGLVVRDSIPRSDDDRVQVALKVPAGLATVDGNTEVIVGDTGIKARWASSVDGIYEWILDVPAGGEVVLTAEYEVCAPADALWLEV